MNNYFKKNNSSKNLKLFLTSLLAGAATAFWSLPHIKKHTWLSADIKSYSFLAWIFYSLLCILIFWSFNHHICQTLKRWKNNSTLLNTPFTSLDIFCSYLVSFLIMSFYQILYVYDFKFYTNFFILFLTITLIIFAWFCNFLIFTYFSSEDKETKILSTDYTNRETGYNDRPIKHSGHDTLGRGPFVQELYSQIVKYPEPESFVFGLYGKLGEGKSSVLHLLRNELDNNDKIIVYPFEPWFYASRHAIIDGFWSGFYKVLNKNYYLTNLKNIFNRYSNILSKGLETSTGVKLPLNSTSFVPQDIRDDIEFLISDINKRLVIIIDDIDRLEDKDRILELLKIVVFSAGLENTIFILSFDNDLVAKCISGNIKDGNKYLEKFVQKPIHLPIPYQPNLDSFLFKKLEKLFTRLSVNLEDASDFKDFYNTDLTQVFSNLRVIKRYLNNLHSTLPPIAPEINLEDFLLLQVLATSFSHIYKDTIDNSYFYIESRSGTDRFFGPIINNQDQFKPVKEHIEYLLKDEQHRELLRTILRKLFFSKVDCAYRENHYRNNVTDEDRVNKRIAHHDVFLKYFTLQVPSTEISDYEVEKFIYALNIVDDKNHYTRISLAFSQYQKNGQLNEFLRKLRIFSKKFDMHGADLCIRAIYERIDDFLDVNDDTYTITDFSQAVYLLLSLVQRFGKGEEIEKRIVEAMQVTPSIPLAVRMRYSLNSDTWYDISSKIDKNLIDETISKEILYRLLLTIHDVEDIIYY